MKKILTLVLAVLLCVAMLTGCANGSGKGSGGKAADEGPSGKVTVMWLAAYNQTDVIKQVLEESFYEKYPNIELVFDEIANSETGPKAMLEAVGKTGAYDVVMQNLTIPALVGVDALEPLDAYIERDAFPIEKMIDNGIFYKDHYYGLPVRGDVRMLHYNEEMFEAAGLDPDKPPTTMDEFMEYARKLKEAGFIPINNCTTQVDNFSSLLFRFGGQFLDEKTQEPAFNSEAGIKALDLMIQMKEEGLLDPNESGWQTSDEIGSYLGGNAAMFDNWPARYVDASMPEKSAIVGHSRVCAVPGEKALVSGWYLVMFNTCKDKDAAWEFMKYVVSPEIQKEVILRGGDCNPTHLDVLYDEELVEKFESMKAYQDSFDKTQVYCKSSQYQSIRDVVTKYMGLAINGDMTTKEALDTAAAEARQLLIDAGELEG